MELVIYNPEEKKTKNTLVKRVILPILGVFVIVSLSFFLSDSSISAKLLKSNISSFQVVNPNFNIQNHQSDTLGIGIFRLEDDDYSPKQIIESDTLTANTESIEIKLGYSDKRVDVIKEYYQNMKSPLANTEVPELYIKYADEYGLNKWSILAAISKIESSGCKYLPGLAKFNCWGYGNGGYAGWESFDQVIRAMSKKFSKVDSNPTSVVKWYCPPCSNPNPPEREKANHNWDNIVIAEMEKINQIAKKYGVPEVNIYDTN